MVLRKKLALLAATTIITATGLVGCSSSNGGSGDPYAVLANKDARKAMQYAIDTQAMCDTILKNGSTPGKTFTAEGLASNDGTDYTELLKDLPASVHDDAKAAELWEKAKEEVGFDTVEIEILSSDNSLSQSMTEFYQSELEAALDGLTVTIKQVPWKQQTELQNKGEFQISTSGWAPDYPDPLTFLDTMASKDGYFATEVGYKNENVDKLIEEAKNETDITKSWAKYAEAEKLILDDAFLIPSYQKSVTVLKNPDITGEVRSVMSDTQGIEWKWADIKRDNKEVNLPASADIPSMDPSLSTDTTSSGAIKQVLEPLFRLDDNGEAVAAGAESSSVSEDGLTWTFKIRKGMKWSNGDDLTAKDYEYGMKRTLDPATKSTYGWIMYDIVGAEDFNTGKGSADAVGVKAVDDYTLEVKLTRPVTYFDKQTYDVRFYPQNQKFVEAQGDKYAKSPDSLLSCGPFKMTAWKTEDMYTLSKNETYWDASTVKINKLNYKVVKDANAQLNLYENGDIDLVGLTAENVDKYKDDPNKQVLKTAGLQYLIVNGGKNSK